MTEFFLIRHAQAEGNSYRMMQGHWDGDITDLGRQQVRALEQRFEGQRVDAVYTSDLHRAVLTAEALTNPRPELPLQLCPELRELDIGPLQACFFGDLLRDIPEEMNAFLYDSAGWHHDGAETFLQAGERGLRRLTEIAEQNAGKTVAVVSHGITIRSMLSRITGIPLSDSERLPICGNTAVTKLSYDSGSFSVEYFNDMSHVEGLSRWKSPAPSFSAAELKLNDRAEADWYSSCYADSWRCAHGSLRGYNPAPYLSAAKNHRLQDRGSVLKLYDGDTPAGLIDMDTLRGAGEGIGWISQLYLCPEYRGMGAGIQVLARGIMHYTDLGRKVLRLHVSENNLRALDFYRRWGFREISCERNSLGRLLLMERPLREERSGK